MDRAFQQRMICKKDAAIAGNGVQLTELGNAKP
jgi:hypothetical protein